MSQVRLIQNRLAFSVARRLSQQHGPRSRFVRQRFRAQFETWWRGIIRPQDKLGPVNNPGLLAPSLHALQMPLGRVVSLCPHPFTHFRTNHTTSLFVYGGKIYEGIIYGPSHCGAVNKNRITADMNWVIGGPS